MNFADIIIHNADVLTINPADDRHEAVATRGGVICAVGRSVEVLQLVGPKTQVIDANGGTILPGFYENHMHLFEGGMALRRLNVASVFGAEALAVAVAAFAAQYPDETLLVAYGANYTMFGDDVRIDRHLLDAAIADRPFYMIATDYHTAWANTVALQQAGVLQGADVGAPSEVVIGDDGHATGELRENAAMQTIMTLRSSGGRESLGMSGHEPENITDADYEEDLAILSDGLKYCARHGITKIINMDGNRYQLDLLKTLEERGELLCRVEVPNRILESSSVDPIEKTVAMSREFSTDKLSCGRIKMFMDGVFDNWTAVVLSDYPDKPGERGTPIVDAARFKQICIDADRQGLQICVHAVGDGAVRMVLDGYEAARDANGQRDSRHRIEHIDTIHPDDIPRLKELGVIASMQPVHPPGSAGLPLEPTITLMGRDRWPYAFNWRMIADAGVPICFATDWPISPIDPLYAIQCALTRKPWADGLPDPKLSLYECLRAYTLGGAFAAFDEEKAGQIAPDMRADLVVLQGSLDSLCLDAPLQVLVKTTICDGKITYTS
jgi:predicted amidohydrolase YtcJ